MRSRGLAEDEGSDSDSKNGCEHWDNRLSDRRKIPAWQYWSSYHATSVRGRLRFDRSLPKRGYVPLRRKGSQVKQWRGTRRRR